jgi:chorismate lyase/3-hydroxybenzoate synthase
VFGVSSGLRLDYVRHGEVASFMEQSVVAQGRQVLGLARWGGAQTQAPWPHAAATVQAPLGEMDLPVLALGDTDEPVWEVWSLVATEPIRHGMLGQQGCVRYAAHGDLVFASVDMDAAPDVGLRDAACWAYDELFKSLAELGFPHPLRLWNHVPGILDEDAGQERYRLFNAGRQDAFLAHARSIADGAPAACALGYPPEQSGVPPHLTLYLLASRRPPVPVENPRQVSAYRYPPQYGERSPTFSRACWWADGADRHFFVSGTASIVGHQTVHVGDVIAQTHETLHNIAALIEQVNAQPGAGQWTAADLRLKVYVRHLADLEAVRGVIAQRWPEVAEPLCLHAVVCRPDLLVEIEAAASGTV